MSDLHHPPLTSTQQDRVVSRARKLIERLKAEPDFHPALARWLAEDCGRDYQLQAKPKS